MIPIRRTLSQLLTKSNRSTSINHFNPTRTNINGFSKATTIKQSQQIRLFSTDDKKDSNASETKPQQSSNNNNNQNNNRQQSNQNRDMRRPGSFSVQDLLKHERKSESFSALPLPEDPVFGADKVKRELESLDKERILPPVFQAAKLTPLEREQLQKIIESEETSSEQKHYLESLMSFYETLTPPERSYIRSQFSAISNIDLTYTDEEKNAVSKLETENSELKQLNLVSLYERLCFSFSEFNESDKSNMRSFVSKYRSVMPDQWQQGLRTISVGNVAITESDSAAKSSSFSNEQRILIGRIWIRFVSFLNQSLFPQVENDRTRSDQKQSIRLNYLNKLVTMRKVLPFQFAIEGSIDPIGRIFGRENLLTPDELTKENTEYYSKASEFWNSEEMQNLIKSYETRHEGETQTRDTTPTEELAWTNNYLDTNFDENLQHPDNIRVPMTKMIEHYIKNYNFFLPEQISPDWEEPMPLSYMDGITRGIVKHRCEFCGDSKETGAVHLDPLNVPLLLRFMTASGQVLPRHQTGTCSKHQRKLANTIKRARHLGVFSYKKRKWSVFYPLDTQSLSNVDSVRNSWTLHHREYLGKIEDGVASFVDDQNSENFFGKK